MLKVFNYSKKEVVDSIDCLEHDLVREVLYSPWQRFFCPLSEEER